ncbi:MAG TPA: 16S rRNA processing protein RimM [Bacteroides sp.]|nr:16S rRNA processing protein RimM [Bacteroides sp.]
MVVPESIKAGKISKPYGLRGSVHLILEPVAGEQIHERDPLFIHIDGQRIPYFVEEWKRISDDQAIVRFEFIDDVALARSVSGCEVFLDPDRVQKSRLASGDDRDLTGYEASDRSAGYLGRVTGLMEHDMNPVLLVDHKGKELMIPVAGEIIIRVNHRKKTILVDLPDGLIDL